MYSEKQRRGPCFYEVSARNFADSMGIATPNQKKIALYTHQKEWGTQKDSVWEKLKVKNILKWEQM